MDNKFFKNSVLIFFLLIILILVYKTVDNIHIVIRFMINVFKFSLDLMKPFIYAFFIAYFLTPLLKFMEEKLFKRNNKFLVKKEKRRALSILILYIIIFLCFSLIINYIIPVISSSIKDLALNLPSYMEDSLNFIRGMLISFKIPESAKIIEDVTEIITKYTEKLKGDMINVYLGRIMEGLFKFTLKFLNILLGLVIAIYLMMDRENIKKGANRIIIAFWSESTGIKIKTVLKKANLIFSRFFIGKTIDSVIVGVICFLVMMLFNVKYALLIGVIIGIANMIPYFGPIAGAVPPIIITLFYSPGKAILVAFLLLIIQQFDGNYLEPKILGDSVGLSPLWVIFAILAGGGLLGVFGMFISVPAIALIKSFFHDWIDKKLQDKIGN